MVEVFGLLSVLFLGLIFGSILFLFAAFARLGRLTEECRMQNRLLQDLIRRLDRSGNGMEAPVRDPVSAAMPPEPGPRDPEPPVPLRTGPAISPEPLIPPEPEPWDPEPPIPLKPEPVVGLPPSEPEPEAFEAEPGDNGFESRAGEILRRIFSWIVVGEEYRTPGVAVEYAVATTWLVRAAVLALLSGIVFFLRYAYERNLIVPELRVVIAVFSGVVMLVAGSRMIGRRYHLIGVGLLGAGFAVLYFALYSALTLYHLCDASTAFFCSIAVTASAMALAVRLDIQLAALIGGLGGYLAPVLFSTGSKNLAGLFGYLLLLGGGVFYTAWRRNWRLLNTLSFLLTIGLYGAALSAHYTPVTADFAIAIAALAAYFILFSLLPIVHNLRFRIPISLLEMLLLITGAAVLLVAGINLTNQFLSLRAAAVVPLGMALFYALMLQIGLSRRIEDRALLDTWLALGAAGLAVAIPLALNARYITFGYVVLAAILFPLARVVGSAILRRLAELVYLIALLRWLIFDLERYFLDQADYGSEAVARLLTLGALVAAAFWIHNLFSRSSEFPAEAEVRGVSVISGMIFIAGLFSYLSVEAALFLQEFLPAARLGGVSVLWGIYALGLITAGIFRKVRALRWTGLVLFTVTVLKIFLIDLAKLDSFYRIVAFIILGFALLGGAFLYIRFRERFEVEDVDEE